MECQAQKMDYKALRMRARNDAASDLKFCLSLADLPETWK